jgi:DNA-binding NarL/FixJ family response regulator
MLAERLVALLFFPPGLCADREVSMNYPGRPRLIIADDRALVVEAFSKMLGTTYNVVATACDGRSLVEATQRLQPDVVLTEIGMPLMNGLEAVYRIKRILPEVKTICVTVHADREIVTEAFRRGVSGYVLKSSSRAVLEKGIEQVLCGNTFISPSLFPKFAYLLAPKLKRNAIVDLLTERQVEVMQLLAEGRSMKEAASVLNLTTRTVAFHKYRFMKNLCLKNDAEVVRYAMQNHVVFNH